MTDEITKNQECKPMRFLCSVNRLVEKMLAIIASVSLITATVLTCGSVFERMMFGKTIFVGNNQLTLFASFWLYFIGMALATAKGAHFEGGMGLQFKHDKRADALLNIVMLTGQLIVFIYFIPYAFDAFSWALNKEQILIQLGWPRAWLLLGLLAGVTTGAIIVALKIMHALHMRTPSQAT